MRIFDIFKRKKSEKPQKDISEPIITVLKLMQDEPSRFDLLQRIEPNSEDGVTYTRFGIRDRKSGHKICWFDHSHVIDPIPSIGITSDEAGALHRAACKIYRSRRDAWNIARHEAHRNIIRRIYDPLHLTHTTDKETP